MQRNQLSIADESKKSQTLSVAKDLMAIAASMRVEMS
jgi:hypothetical protein